MQITISSNENDIKIPVNEIIQGNCIDIMKEIPDRSIDLIFADPPYNLQLQNELMRPNQTIVDAINDEWDKFDNFEAYDQFTREWLTQCRRILKDDGTIWVIGSYHNIFRVGTVMMDLGYWILNDIHWYKTNPMPNFRGTRFTNATETLIWAKKSADQKKYTFNYHAMKNLNEEKQMQNVWYIPLCTGQERIKINGKKAHSTQKPEALLYRVILSSSNPNDLILDPFFGSGTTGAVARKLQRNFIGIELESEYINVARQRIENIPLFSIEETELVTRSRRTATKVSFGQLIEAQYIMVGQTIFSKNRTIIAKVKADSQLNWNNITGSIHKIAALAQGQTNCNGWDYWYSEDDAGNLVSIDILREQYRTEYNLE